jgi:hypothetical protein
VGYQRTARGIISYDRALDRSDIRRSIAALWRPPWSTARGTLLEWMKRRRY